MFRHLNFIPLLKLGDTFVVREQKESDTMALLRHQWLSSRRSTFLFCVLKCIIDLPGFKKDDPQSWCQVCFYSQHILAFIVIFLAGFSGKLFGESCLS